MSSDPVEKFFGQTRQRMSGNFYIDIVDVMAVAKMQVLHQLLKYDIIPDKTCQDYTCPSCTELVTPDNEFCTKPVNCRHTILARIHRPSQTQGYIYIYILQVFLPKNTVVTMQQRMCRQSS